MKLRAILVLGASACGASPEAVVPATIVLVPPAIHEADAGREPVAVEAPAASRHALEANFENRIRLLGYRFDPESARPGQQVKLTFWWRCDDPIEDGWSLFTQVRDDGSGKTANLDFEGTLREPRDGRQALGPDRWVKDQTYVDEQIYTLPDDLTGETVTVLIGLWKGDARLRIVAGPNDGDNRAIVGTIGTGMQAARAAPADDTPRLTVTKLPSAGLIRVDGKDDEPAWQAAASTPPFVDVGTGKPNASFPVSGLAKMLWDDDNLYVVVHVRSTDFYMGFTNAAAQPRDFTPAGQPKLWIKDTVEMMLEPDAVGSNTNYYELQINPQNRVFKSQFDSLQQPSGGPNGPFGHESWDPKLKSAVVVHRGPGGKPTGYRVEAAIPWSAYAKAPHHPPRPGEVWRINFYAMKNNGGVSWSPILGQGNFHKASRFGRVTWAAP